MTLPYDVIYQPPPSAYLVSYEMRLGEHMIRDSTGRYWIAFTEYSYRSPAYVAIIVGHSDDAEQWTFERLSGISLYVVGLALVVDGEDRPHVFYLDVMTSTTLGHQMRTESGWSYAPCSAPSSFSWYYSLFNACVNKVTGNVHLVGVLEDSGGYCYTVGHVEFDGLTEVTKEIAHSFDDSLYGRNNGLVGVHVASDTNGNVHLVNHATNLWPEDITRLWHIVKTPEGGWGSATELYSFYDKYGDWADSDGALHLLADDKGKVHLAVVQGYESAGSQSYTTDIEYRLWTPTDGWGPWELVADKVWDDTIGLGGVRVCLLPDGSPFVAWSGFGYGPTGTSILEYHNISYSQKPSGTWEPLVNVTWDTETHWGLNICLNEQDCVRLMWAISDTDTLVQCVIPLAVTPEESLSFWW